jgi:ankyrin repeat protein
VIVLGTVTASLAAAAVLPKSFADAEWANAKLVTAVRAGDVASMSAALDAGADANVKDAEGTPAVMLATLYAGAPALQLLLDRGADPNAVNGAHATALIWAAGDGEKVRALLKKGADPNIQSGPGRTALLTAASRDGAFEVVKMLVEKGADINAKDHLEGFVWAGAGANTPLIEAAKTRDARTVRYLLDKGADVNAKDQLGGTALLQAVVRGNVEVVKLLLERGAEVNYKASGFQITPLIGAAHRESVEIADLLLKHGAKVEDTDVSGSTALMWAAYPDHANPELVERLLKAGANRDAKNKEGETALTWASRRGETPILGLLRGGESAQGARPASPAMPVSFTTGRRPEPAELRDAVARSLAVLDEGGPQFFKVSGCISCHNQTLPVMAGALARQKGIQPNEKTAKQQLGSILAFIKPATEILAENTEVLPDMQVSGGYILEALAAGHYQADALTAATVHNIAAKQMSDGSWVGWSPRPPIENGDIQATAYSIRSLRLYGVAGRKAEFDARVAKALNWLRKAKAVTTEEKAMKLFALRWADAPQEEIDTAARQLMAEQREDGGWSQLTTLASDAYATGKVMVALNEAAGVKPANPAYQRGAAYLMGTQETDGSWHVTTRAFPFQPLKDSGFPHGRDQWISSAGTSWASMALSYAIETPQVALRF